MGDMKNAHNILDAKPAGRDHSEDLSVDGKIEFEWILGKWGGKLWTGWICLRIRTRGELLWTR